MSENGKGRSAVAGVFNMVGGVSGLLSILLIIWKGGTLWQMVHDQERRIAGIEATGSTTLREHIKVDDERVEDLKVQTRRLIAITDHLVEYQTDLKVMNAKLDALKESFDEHKKAFGPFEREMKGTK